MWTFVRENLVLKIAVVVMLTLGVGFAIPTVLSARVQAQELERSGKLAAENVAQGLAAGMRTAMLSGNGITARAMVRDVRERLATAQVRVFAPNGEEVFGEPAQPPALTSLPTHVQQVLGDAKQHTADAATEAIPIANEPRCRKCHDDGTLRGVLTMGTGGAKVQLAGGDETLDVVSTIAQSAFEQIMTAEKESLLDGYFEEMGTVSGIVGVTVVDPSGDVSFGKDLGVPEATILETLGAGTRRTVTVGTDRVRVVPLANAAQCHGCHEASDKWRGALLTRVGPTIEDSRSTTLRAADMSLRHVMLSGLGRMIARFLDEVASTGAVTTLTLHDAEGRLFRDAFATPTPPDWVKDALASGEMESAVQRDDASEHFVFVAPLANDAECQQCHGTDQPLRGAIEVVLDTSEAAATRRRLAITSTLFGGATIVLTLAMLWVGLRSLVLRPVTAMGTVADRVGNGQLDARVDVRSRDEIGRLGERLNHMIGEIRKKLELSKFVSKATVGSVDAAESQVRRLGRRTRATMLFSDIRGFTAYSETVEPEDVVGMLNTYLDAQAEVVEQFGGDIDKFVGDELMAHFHGENMEARAVQAAIAMAEAVARLNANAPVGAPRLEVGIGINVGDVVFGAMGARNRMDFTVIGDAVNLGARLCSAASPGQIVVSAAIRNAATGLQDVALERLPPLAVKGKREPLEVYAVTARRPS